MLKQGHQLEIVLLKGRRRQRIVSGTSVLGRLRHETLMRLYDEVPMIIVTKEHLRARWQYQFSAPSPI